MRYIFKIILVCFVLIEFKTFPSARNVYLKNYICPTDSIKIIADNFLIYNDFINSYEISDKDIDDFYNSNNNLVIKYFPIILEKYDLTLYAQFNLAIILYLENKKSFLINLWCKYKHYYNGGNVKTADEINYFDKIIYLFEYYKIPLKNITNKC